jgi:hypothetical protein
MVNLAFGVLAVGQGHMTQAKAIYDIVLRNGYSVPIIFCMVSNKNTVVEKCNMYFTHSKIEFVKIYANEDDMNSMNLIGNLRFFASMLRPFDTSKYEVKYNIGMWVNFWVPTIHTFNMPAICIAPQFSVKDWRMKNIVRLFKRKQVPVSIMEENPYSPYVVPSLINLNPITRRRGYKKVCVAYAVSGKDFGKVLEQIATNNPDFEIHFFFGKEKPSKLSPKIVWHATSVHEFKAYMEICCCVLATAGNELVQECAFNGIPVAIMPCSAAQFEQMCNYEKYVNRLRYAEPMTPTMTLKKLANRDVTKVQRDFEKSVEKREDIIVSLIEEILTKNTIKTRQGIAIMFYSTLWFLKIFIQPTPDDSLNDDIFNVSKDTIYNDKNQKIYYLHRKKVGAKSRVLQSTHERLYYLPSHTR